MQIKIEKQPKATLKLDITVPVDKVKEMYDKTLNTLVENAELKGFRKGTAPKKLVEEKTDVSKLHGDVINELLKEYYARALKENHISPVAHPKVEIKEFSLEKDFEFMATVAIKPEVKMKDYKKALKELYTKQKATHKKDNAEKLKKGGKIEGSDYHMSPNAVIDTLLENAEVEISELLIEDETNRMMSRLINQTQALGLSTEDYLKSQNKTAEQLKNEYNKMAEKNIKAEFVLAHLVKQEKVEATDEEIQQTAKATGDPQALENLKDPMQKWYIKSILDKNKLISTLIEQTEERAKKDE